MTSKKEKNINVVRLDANGFPVVETVENDLKTFQKVVGGLIEVVPFGKILCIINEEGKLLELAPNFAFPVTEYEDRLYFDVIMGDVIFVGDDGMEFRGLTDEEVADTLLIVSKGREALHNIRLNQMMEDLENGRTN